MPAVEVLGPPRHQLTDVFRIPDAGRLLVLPPARDRRQGVGGPVSERIVSGVRSCRSMSTPLGWKRTKQYRLSAGTLH